MIKIMLGKWAQIINQTFITAKFCNSKYFIGCSSVHLAEVSVILPVITAYDSCINKCRTYSIKSEHVHKFIMVMDDTE